MNVSRAFKSDSLSDLPIDLTALYTLSAPSVPEGARQEAIELARDGVEVDTKVDRLLRDFSGIDRGCFSVYDLSGRKEARTWPGRKS